MKGGNFCRLRVAPIRQSAPAKVNLALHVTGRRPDGYHTLDSLVVFADVADQIELRPASELTLQVCGPFAEGVPTDENNLVLKAAHMLRAEHKLTAGAAITLAKNLPHAAGIGGGSSDAAATLHALARLWDVPCFAADAVQALLLGADVPVCMKAPQPARMSGIGEVLAPVPTLPDAAVVLVKPSVAVPTAQVFSSMTSIDGADMMPVPAGQDFEGFCDWLRQQRNDMERAACKIAPEIAETLDQLRACPAVKVARMSGSGATCFGLVPDLQAAAQVAQHISNAAPDLWVAPAKILPA